MKRELSPKQRETLSKHGFPKGTSGNPGGRSWTRILSAAYRELLSQPWENDRRMSWAQAIALAQARKAVEGDPRCAAEIADRCEGKPPQAVRLSTQHESLPYTMHDFANLSDEDLMRFILECSKVLKVNPPRVQ